MRTRYLDCSAVGPYSPTLVSHFLHERMTAPDREIVDAFRLQVQDVRERRREAWDRSRSLVSTARLGDTLQRLRSAIEKADSPELLKARLIEALSGGPPTEGGLRSVLLKALTGLPPSKALRALCVLFDVVGPSSHTASSLSPAEVETFLRTHHNPYDLLLGAEAPSLLDLGAGDLSFAAELVDQYVAALAARGTRLTLHCVERLRPGSHLGGRLHVNPRYAEKLLGLVGGPPPRGLDFRFFGDQDMFDLGRTDAILPRYTVVTCHAPATPTFAYEPTRVSPALIEQDLRATKGDFRRVHDRGEEALEVHHGGRVLLFPAWKFEVRGPLVLLDMMARRAGAAVLSAIDSQVFWEILSQLVADDAYRPRDTIFTPAVIQHLFGEIYTKLTKLPLGVPLDLSTLTALRPSLPPERSADTPRPTVRFRYVEVRRGAIFPGLPASQTARLFADMKEEETPWFLLLVPESCST